MIHFISPFFKYVSMNLYQYIAGSNPTAANGLCEKYGYYNIQSYDELAYCLEGIVASNGEPAFKEIMQLHPDTEVILELNVPAKVSEPLQTNDMKKCPCEDNYMNATGSGVSGLANQTNVMILVAAMIVSIAIISMKK